MGLAGNIMQATGAAIQAFRSAFASADPQGNRIGGGTGDEWNRWQARRDRYALSWRLYENTALAPGGGHRDAGLAARYKAQLELYRHARHLYNPAYRLAEFWAGRLTGGLLDKDAGDGKATPSALPILCDRATLRRPIVRVWADSLWQVNKEVYARWGAVLGSVGIKVVDDTARGQVRLELVHPGHLKRVDFDPLGNVKAYLLERWDLDPRDVPVRDLGLQVDPDSRKAVLYQERCFRDGDNVVFQTYLDGKPYPWNGAEAEWSEPYGFVPLVVCHHESNGLQWGQNCWHAGQGSRFSEVDNLASGLSDQINKAIRGPMLLTGVKHARDITFVGQGDPTGPEGDGRAQPGSSRSAMPLLLAPAEAKAQHLTYDLDIVGVCAHTKDLLADIEKNFPELLADTGNLSGTVTAEAVRNARELATAKVQARRVPYDDALVRAQMMAVAIGGFRGHPDFAGYGLDSFAAGKLAHQIGLRPVFDVDAADKLKLDAQFWAAASQAVTAGCPLSVYLERSGWPEDEVAKVVEAKAAEQAAALDHARSMADASPQAADGQGQGQGTDANAGPAGGGKP